MSLVVKELIFLGTGTSGCLPYVRCLVNPSGCTVCPTTLGNPRSRNRRRNTSLLVRAGLPDDDDPETWRNIVIDVGKTFYDGTVEWFPEYGIRRIDAVILTHPHADAILGVDDLRAWSVESPFFKGPIPVFLSADTMRTIETMFPYCADTSKATGGGLVPQLAFQVFDDDTDALDVLGLRVVPLKVEHGEFGDGRPFYCHGFRFDDIVYVSDCSLIPPQTDAKMHGSKLMVMDALRSTPHKSHFSIQQSMDTLLKYQPLVGLMVGFAHDLAHDELRDLAAIYLDSGCLAVPEDLPNRVVSHENLNHGSGPIATNSNSNGSLLAATVKSPGLENWNATRGRVQVLAPAYDGLRVRVAPGIDLDAARGERTAW
ncbi:hypothetical protein H9P43_007389 [Blastocladiella emersonii ATCC 22665]|nr:hypothetical protein H9P43_007389 [Blastocladiella emersonii ATCC 22665]